jgi:hypothetical protein
MSDPLGEDEPLRSWVGTAGRIRTAIEGLSDGDLDLRGGADGWSIRETVHHLVEANLIASNILIAAISQSGCVYDWSWVNPDKGWMERLGYRTAPVGPALATLRSLCEHMAELIKAVPGAFDREVQLLDSPGAEPHRTTVRALVSEQIEHVEGHLGTVREIRAAHGR